jgi:hypothetical protein
MSPTTGNQPIGSTTIGTVVEPVRSDKFDFLYSVKFYALILGSASTVLIDPSFTTQPWQTSLGKFLALVSAGFITINVAGKFSDAIKTK